MLCSPPAHPRSPLHMQQTQKADVGFGQRWRGDHVGSNLTVLSCKEHAKQVLKVSAKMFGDEGDLESTHLATALMTCLGEMCQTGEVKRVELKGLWDDLLSKCCRFKLQASAGEADAKRTGHHARDSCGEGMRRRRGRCAERCAMGTAPPECCASDVAWSKLTSTDVS